jgi:hypothetical protein
MTCTFSSCLLGAFFFTTLAVSQQGHLNEPPGKLEIGKHPLVLEPATGQRPPQVDAAKLREEADELSKLAQSVPADVDQSMRGKLSREVPDKLKRIEKLSKHLRSELVP